ncbi:hypothetical protein G9A89_019444 [Geosiphon pyriformis]|nr:hypothetical protein G9A89_019444 [Geosiphon pyriformis]
MDDFPKLQLDTKEDVLFLKEGLHESALATVEERLGVDGDPQLKPAVSKLVSKWVDELFKLAAGNIQVNGIDYEKAMKAKEEVQPFDEVLYRKVQDMHGEIEETMLKVTNRRKTIPEQAKALIQDALKRQSAMVNCVNFDAMNCENHEISSVGSLPEMPRREQNIATYNQGLVMLSDLKKSASVNFSKLERVQIVINDILPMLPSPKDNHT